MKYIVFREFSLRYGFLTDWEVRGYVLQTLGAWNLQVLAQSGPQ
jgi:hypothetical protein